LEAPLTDSIDFSSFGTLVDTVPRDVTWVWDPYIPDGSLTLLSAFMKVGKSTFVAPLAVAIASGSPFMGYPTKGCPVAYIAIEEHVRDVVNRFDSFGAEAVRDNIYFHSAPVDPTAAIYSQIKTFIQAKGVGLVILDTLASWWRVEDENDNAQVKRAVLPWLAMARETGAAVLLIHHTGKMEQEGGKAIRGASSLFALVDQALVLRLTPAGKRSTKRVLEVEGRYEQTPARTVIELGPDDIYRVVSKDGLLSEAYVASITDALRQAPEPVSAQALVALTGITLRQVSRHLREVPGLITQGKGVKADPFLYSLPKQLLLP